MSNRENCQTNHQAGKTKKTVLRCQRGFTLVELLTVLIIIAVLVAIAVPVYAHTEQTSRDKVDQANVRILNGATIQWMCASQANDPVGKTTDTLKAALENHYISGWPSSPTGRYYALDSSSGKWTVVEAEIDN